MVKVYADEREKASKVPKYLSAMGVTVIYKQLPVGDYIPAEGIVIERKRVDDLARSVFDGRFFDQLRRLKESSDKVVLVIEGNLNYLRARYASRYRAIEAAIITASIVNSLPILHTQDTKHTAEVIKYIAEKFQESKQRVPTPSMYKKVVKPKTTDLRKWQLFILSSFPGIGPILAERLLIKFGSLKNVLNSSPSELSRVEGMTEEKAWLIVKIVNESYTSSASAGTDLTKFMERKDKG
ncbi:MAG: hypothetical protein J7L12_03845 [Desulfurococcales archaeon]|nr:hypothetical protein [Desulfurococcales archaeon]